ncbi:ACT-7 domain-containing protein [Mycena kentingensis (nom. inval.)]|nr:ACT-7 domain-containing protein [Mycena kentingensis (nom. inval.)]
MDFASPTTISQDLLLIQVILGVQQPKQESPQRPDPEEDSSGDESEDEVQANLMEDDIQSSGSTLDASSSESQSSDDEDDAPQKINLKDLDDDEAGGAAPPAMTYFQTKNEVSEGDITVPDLEEVAADETLEAVGQVFSIVDKTVIVKGASPYTLDSDTLLVFEDRKVLGYIYDTFGPTTQPLYQVRFSAAYPIDTEKVQLARPVFHVPHRSKFVLVEQIKRFRGSDASNMHDEEPDAHELDFSDDEAEAEHKRRMKYARGSSVASSSRAGTPSPALMRDQDMGFYEANPYGEHTAYDDNYGAGPSSRPAPMPYDDDPYADIPMDAPLPLPRPPPKEFDSGRGRGRGRNRNDSRGRRGGGGGGRGRGSATSSGSGARGYGFGQPPPRSNSPTSMAIARATGQYPDGAGYVNPSHFQTQTQSYSTPAAPWPAANYGTPGPGAGFVQPHINPRFASVFGFGVMAPGQPPPHGQYQNQYYPQGNNGAGWSNGWNGYER